ncbi:MAG: ferric reductase-like transmembrane domain-containing protein [Polyangiaceae bacterium]|nr:ferric reductase-like transmembrane domain-containing protein [Polyangiaceae bacterium]
MVTGLDIWNMTRASGFVAFGLLWLSVVWGLFASTRLARGWPGAAQSIDLHEHLSFLALSFTLLHVLVLALPSEHRFTLVELLVPFAARRDRVLLGIGQLALGLSVVITVSFYVRKRIGPRLWRLLHYTALLVYVGALLHATLLGTDSATPGARLYYFATTGVVLFLLFVRVGSALQQRGLPGPGRPAGAHATLALDRTSCDPPAHAEGRDHHRAGAAPVGHRGSEPLADRGKLRVALGAAERQ